MIDCEVAGVLCCDFIVMIDFQTCVDIFPIIEVWHDNTVIILSHLNMDTWATRCLAILLL